MLGLLRIWPIGPIWCICTRKRSALCTVFGDLSRWHPLVEAVSSRADLGKGKMMFEGLVSRFERNQLLDELYGDLDSPYPRSMGNKLDGATAETDVPSANGNSASSAYQEAEVLGR